MRTPQAYSRSTLAIATVALLSHISPLCAQTHATKIKADSLWAAPWSLTGKGATVGMFEAGGYAEVSHSQFASKRVALPKLRPHAGTDKHATNVASVLVASGKGGRGAYRGVIHEGKLQSYYAPLDSNQSHMFRRLFAIERWSVSNHSYGAVAGWYWDAPSMRWAFNGRPTSAAVPDPFGAYLDDARIYDSVTFAANYVLPVVAAGNDKWSGPNVGDSVWVRDTNHAWQRAVATAGMYLTNGGLRGYDCMPSDACAKNVLTVGGIDVVDTLRRTSNTGPTNDGRIKPDVVALAQNVHAAGQDGIANSYSSVNGTSFAAPAVAGVAVQLQQLFKRYFVVDALPSTIKAVLCHTARDLGNPGPDYRHGWGLVDALAAARLLETANNDGAFAVNEYRVTPGITQRFFVKAVNANTPIKITIAWSDPPASVTEGGPQAGVAYATSTTPKLIHDLDLSVHWSKNNVNNTARPWVLNPTQPHLPATRGINQRDNVEQVLLVNPDPSVVYEVRVTMNGAVTTPEQLFSRCVSGATLFLPAPDSVNVAATPSVDGKGDEPQAFSVNVSWQRVPEAATYTLRYRRSGTNAWTTHKGITTNSRLVAGLELGTYQFQVQAHRGSTTSAWKTVTRSFTVTPVVPSNLAVSNITPTGARLSWTGDSNASSYRVFMSELDANNQLKGNGWMTFNTSSTTLTRSGLRQDAKYAWSVQSVYSADIKSESASTQSFWTTTTCEAYEPNNAIAQAAAVEVNRTITARSCSNDVSDWYSVVVPAQQRNIRVVLYQQPVPVKLALYRMVNGNASLIAESADNDNGTGMKTLTANGLNAGETMYVRLFNTQGPYANGQTYSFRVNTKSTAW